MSDITLTTVASTHAQEKLLEFLNKIKDPELTGKGRQDYLRELILFTFIRGHNFAKERYGINKKGAEELIQDLKKENNRVEHLVHQIRSISMLGGSPVNGDFKELYYTVLDKITAITDGMLRKDA